MYKYIHIKYIYNNLAFTQATLAKIDETRASITFQLVRVRKRPSPHPSHPSHIIDAYIFSFSLYYIALI